MDGLLRLELPPGCSLIAYADDATLLISGNTRNEIEEFSNTCLLYIQSWAESVCLRFSAAKTSAIMLKGKFSLQRPPRILFQNSRVKFKKTVVCLGLTIGSGLTFHDHARTISDKARNAFLRLQRVARATWGLDFHSLRILYKSVFESIVCYAAPVWFPLLSVKRHANYLRSAQRSALLVVTHAYRTSPTLALPVIAGVLPIDLLVRQRALTHLHKHDIVPHTGGVKQIRLDMLQLWQEEWDAGPSGRHTYSIWSSVTTRLSQKWVTTDFHLSQFWTGHGDFRAKLFSFRLVIDPDCPDCGTDDTPTHAVLECPSILASVQNLPQPAVPSRLVASQTEFSLFTRHVQHLMRARQSRNPYYH